MPCRPVPSAGRAWVEAASVVAHGEREQSRCVCASEISVRAGLGVLRDVVQRLEHAEVHGGLDLLRVPPERRPPRPSIGTAALRACDFERGREPSVGEQRRVDAAREVAQVLEGRRGLRPAARRASRWLSLGRVASRFARRPSCTLSATSCCCTPSWMLRSSLRRSSSCAATRRCRDARRSSISRTLRSTSPAWVARSRTSASFAAFIGSSGAGSSVIAPSRSPWCRTSSAYSPSSSTT